MEKIHKKSGFDRLIMLVNPASTNYAHAKKMVAEIKRQFTDKPVLEIKTSSNGKTDTATSMLIHAKKFGPMTLFCIVAGDGTVNFVINFLLMDKRLPAKAKLTVILPLWGGNGNDMSSMLNGGSDAAKIENIMRRGNVVSIHPLYCRIKAADGRQTINLAGNSMGFGASGLLSEMLNAPAHRESKLFLSQGGKLSQTILTIWSGLYASQKFKIEESGVQFDIFERSIFNGPISAKYYHQPVQLLEDHFYMDTWRRKIPITTPLSALFSMRRRTLRRSEDHFSKKAEFTVLESIWAQFDAEPCKISANSKIEIGIYDHPFYALSTVISAKK